MSNKSTLGAECCHIETFLLSHSDLFLRIHCRWCWLLLHLTTFNDTHTHTHNPLDSSGREISPTQRPLPCNTQHSQGTNIHAPGGIRIRNPSKRADAGLRLRPCRHRDRLIPFHALLLYATKVYVTQCLTSPKCVGICTEIRWYETFRGSTYKVSVTDTWIEMEIRTLKWRYPPAVGRRERNW